MDTTLDVLPGEGEVKTVTRICVRKECEECGEPAHYKASYLLPNARSNPASKAYQHDDCSWCSDLDVFFCRTCLKGGWHPKREGYQHCSIFPANKRFAHMFLHWEEIPNGN